MKVILTGITGNLGYEIALELLKQEHDVIAIIRQGSEVKIPQLQGRLFDVVHADLLDEVPLLYENEADYIIHCAGEVHFKKSGDHNVQMMRKIIGLAQRKNLPVYFISTAFVYRPDDRTNLFNNAYEKDKWDAEQLLSTSNVVHQILRPGIVVGHSATGVIRNTSGFYLVVLAFLHALQKAHKEHQILRFPRIDGVINLVTVDQVAQSVLLTLGKSSFPGPLFAINPQPPTFIWLLEQTLKHHSLLGHIEFIDIPFGDFTSLTLTSAERELFALTSNFSPYWSIPYSFPDSLCKENMITPEYLSRTLSYFETLSHNSYA